MMQDFLGSESYALFDDKETLATFSSPKNKGKQQVIKTVGKFA
jgi:hypothetical protein